MQESGDRSQKRGTTAKGLGGTTGPKGRYYRSTVSIHTTVTSRPVLPAVGARYYRSSTTGQVPVRYRRAHALGNLRSHWAVPGRYRAGTTARALLTAVLPPPLPGPYRSNLSNSRHRTKEASQHHRYYRLGPTGTTGAPLQRLSTTAAATASLPSALVNSLPPRQNCLARPRYYRSGDTGTTGRVESAPAPPASED